MNRRSFLSDILKAGIAAAILPSALTYTRKWKPVQGLLLPDYRWDASDYSGEWHLVMYEQLPDGTVKLGKSTIVKPGRFQKRNGSQHTILYNLCQP